ncbi:MAG: SAM-dependent methyltransferase [Verrucomicrobiales bacterium]|jgi:SAM-dependent methyltransferase
MKEERWDAIADKYDDEVLSVFDHDRRGLVREKIKKYGSRALLASDLGCGLGKFLPLMASQFKQVHACDYSEGLLENARRTNSDLENVGFAKVDLIHGSVRLPKVDFTLCVNVLLTPILAERLSILKNMTRQLSRGGHLVLVVPSLESALYANARLVQWNLRSGVAEIHAESEGFRAEEPSGEEVARKGVVYAGDMKMKHFIREELTTIADGLRLDTVSVEKLEYRWDTEFKEPPGWMGEPFPWDWLAVFRKR